MAKSARRTKDNIVTMPIVEANAPAVNQSAEVPDHDIAYRAYELYCERGWEDGHDLDDWLQAEREVRAGMRSHVA